jgi:hypothetical protein
MRTAVAPHDLLPTGLQLEGLRITGVLGRSPRDQVLPLPGGGWHGILAPSRLTSGNESRKRVRSRTKGGKSA